MRSAFPWAPEDGLVVRGGNFSRFVLGEKIPQVIQGLGDIFLGWWMKTWPLKKRVILSDLQRWGMKMVTAGITWPLIGEPPGEAQKFHASGKKNTYNKLPYMLMAKIHEKHLRCIKIMNKNEEIWDKQTITINDPTSPGWYTREYTKLLFRSSLVLGSRVTQNGVKPKWRCLLDLGISS